MNPTQGVVFWNLCSVADWSRSTGDNLDLPLASEGWGEGGLQYCRTELLICGI